MFIYFTLSLSLSLSLSHHRIAGFMVSREWLLSDSSDEAGMAAGTTSAGGIANAPKTSFGNVFHNKGA